jgi:hypothetical protein
MTITFVKTDDAFPDRNTPILNKIHELNIEIQQSSRAVWAAFDGRILEDHPDSIEVLFCPLSSTVVVGKMVIRRDGKITTRNGIATEFLKEE